MGSRSRRVFAACVFASIPVHAVGLVAVGLTGCGATSGAAGADPTLVTAREQQLLAPFGETRTIVADRLDIEMTANFHDDLTRPAVLPGVQDEQRIERDDGGSELRYTTAAATTPLRFVLGNTDFRVTRAARIVVLGGRRDLTLRADVDGSVTVLAAGGKHDFAAIRFADGRMVPRP